MAVTETAEDVVITSDEEMLEKVVNALAGIMSTGQSYTIFGSRVVTKADMDELQGLETMYRTRILNKVGAIGIHQIDHRAEGEPL